MLNTLYAEEKAQEGHEPEKPISWYCSCVTGLRKSYNFPFHSKQGKSKFYKCPCCHRTVEVKPIESI